MVYVFLPNGMCREMARCQRWVTVRFTTEAEKPRINAHKELLSFLQYKDSAIIKNVTNGVHIKTKSFKLYGKTEKKTKLSTVHSSRQQPYLTSRGYYLGRWQGSRRPVT